MSSRIFLYNFLSRKIEEFRPIGKVVGLYTCGPTVYDFVHIGNWRTFVFEDVLKRVLEFNGYKVKHVMNLTDIDDKVISRARAEKVTIEQLTKKYADVFFADLKKLNILEADDFPKATDHITPIIRIIEVLLEKGFAYERDGSIYFSIGKFKDYGRLSGANILGVKAGARVDVDEYDKENPQDFALWKKESPDAYGRGEAFDSPWGIGRPGWHIECSAMSIAELGESFDPSTELRINGTKFRTIDIHTGGVDLLFPHHENEIAQSEAATGKKFVKYWLEGEHLLVEGDKMAKRLGNIYKLSDIVKKGFDPLSLRYLFLTAHYRSKLNFTWESLEGAQNSLNNLRNRIANMAVLPNVGCSDYEERFFKAVNDDLDLPKALSIFWELVKEEEIPGDDRLESILDMDRILGLSLDKIEPASLPKGAKALIEKREELRSKGKFAEADKYREKMRKMGVEVEDTPKGPRWKVKSESK